jgi:hypothetical protein
MEEGARFVDHLNFFNKLVTQLISMDENIEEKDKVVILVSSLPSSWEQLVMNILIGKTTLNFQRDSCIPTGGGVLEEATGIFILG